MFVLGYLYWMFNRKMDGTEAFLTRKLHLSRDPQANLSVLKAGYHYGDTTETFTSRYEVKKADLPKGKYRSIMGNQATAMGLIAAAQQSGLQLFYGSYPITPASDILHELAKHKTLALKLSSRRRNSCGYCLYWRFFWRGISNNWFFRTWNSVKR